METPEDRFSHDGAQFNQYSLTKNDVPGNLTELHVKACTCSNRQKKSLVTFFKLLLRQLVKWISACYLMDPRMDRLYV